MGSIERKEQEKVIRRNDILKAAEKIFIKKGYEGSTIDEIAASSEYTKRTIYQYFQSKEEILSALALCIYEHLISDFERIFQENIKGFYKIKRYGDTYLKIFLEYPDQFLISSMSKKIHTSKVIKAPKKLSVYYRRTAELNIRMLELYGNTIAQGKADNSISNKIDKLMGSIYLVSSLFNLFSEMAENRDVFAQGFKFDMNEYLRFALDSIYANFLSKTIENEENSKQ